MVKTYAYFQTTNGSPEQMREIVPKHTGYWKSLGLPGYLGGPFTDRSGGLIIFEAETNEDANDLVNGDPFVIENLIDEMWVKEWSIEVDRRK